MEAWTLPVDILMEEILPRLPARSLLRFKCVCKFFQTLISSPQFVDHHLCHSLSSDSNLLHILIGVYGGLYTFHFDSPEFPAVSFRLPGYIDENCFPHFSFLESCNGLVCISMSSSLIIFNPSTRIYRKITDDYTGCGNYGFGFDDINHDYKIVRFWIYDEHYGYGGGGRRKEVQVYSMKSDSWSLVEETSTRDSMAPMGSGGAVIHNHLVHWTLFDESNGGQHRIGCFDLRNNRWGDDVPVPDYHPEAGNNGAAHFADVLFQTYRNKKYDLVHLGVFDGCLCLLIDHIEGDGIDVWVMKEYGVKDSWVNLVRISITDVVEWLKITPFAYGKGSITKNLIGVDLQSEFSSYNIRDKIRMWSEKHGVPPFFQACMCKGSLVSIPGGVKFEIQALTQQSKTQEDSLLTV